MQKYYDDFQKKKQATLRPILLDEHKCYANWHYTECKCLWMRRWDN